MSALLKLANARLIRRAIVLFDCLSIGLIEILVGLIFADSLARLPTPTVEFGVKTFFSQCGDWCNKPMIFVSVPEGMRKVPNNKGILELVFGCTGNPCVIDRSDGGDRFVFAMAGKAALSIPTMSFVINGWCASGCTIFADMVRERVCLGPKARFAFHQGYKSAERKSDGLWVIDESGPRFKPHYSSDINKWLERKGGNPTRGHIEMSILDASKIWRPCLFNPPLPRPDPRPV